MFISHWLKIRIPFLLIIFTFAGFTFATDDIQPENDEDNSSILHKKSFVFNKLDLEQTILKFSNESDLYPIYIPSGQKKHMEFFYPKHGDPETQIDKKTRDIFLGIGLIIIAFGIYKILTQPNT